jgi:septum formation protein
MENSSNFLIYLASQSPRRSALLQQIGVRHRIHPVDVDESVLPNETPRQYVERLAGLKAQTLWARLDERDRRPVLGADTAVALDEHILGKPRDEQDGLRMLRLLSGRTHQVYTAVALRCADGLATLVNVSDVSFRALTDEECIAYWRSGEPADKAGSYAIQGLGAIFIERICGSYSGIVGLALHETAQLLQSVGWRPGGDGAAADGRASA